MAFPKTLKKNLFEDNGGLNEVTAPADEHVKKVVDNANLKHPDFFIKTAKKWTPEEIAANPDKFQECLDRETPGLNELLEDMSEYRKVNLKLSKVRPRGYVDAPKLSKKIDLANLTFREKQAEALASFKIPKKPRRILEEDEPSTRPNLRASTIVNFDEIDWSTM